MIEHPSREADSFSKPLIHIIAAQIISLCTTIIKETGMKVANLGIQIWKYAIQMRGCITHISSILRNTTKITIISSTKSDPRYQFFMNELKIQINRKSKKNTHKSYRETLLQFVSIIKTTLSALNLQPQPPCKWLTFALANLKSYPFTTELVEPVIFGTSP